MMVLTLDNLAKEYKLLPSECLSRASTLDLYVLDVGTRYSKYRQDLAEGRKVHTDLSIQQMKDMISKARSE